MAEFGKSFEKHLEIEMKVIHLMLRHRAVVDELLNDGYRVDFFEEVHKPLVQAVYDEYVSSDGKRLLTRNGYQQLLVEKGDKRNLVPNMTVFDKCDLKVHADRNDLTHLKRMLLEGYAGRSLRKVLQQTNYNADKKGFLFAMRELRDSLDVALVSTEPKETVYASLSELQDDYIQQIEDDRNNPQSIITCKIPEVDNAINVGFRPMHLTLVVADVGGHKCVKHDSQVATADGGYLLAANAIGKNPNLLSVRPSMKVESQKSVGVVSNGVQQCFRLTTRMGFEVETTGNHPFLTMAGYEKLENLLVGQHVALSRKSPFGSVNAAYGLPEWLGCMYSDGGTTQSTLTFTNFDDHIVQIMRTATRALGGKFKAKTLRGSPVDGNYLVSGLLSVTRKYDLQGKRATVKSIHPDIYRWNQDSLSLFLRAMYGCDGSLVVSKSGRVSVVYSSSSRKLAADVRNLLLKFGLVAILTPVRVKHRGRYKESWQVKLRDSEQVHNFLLKIGFLGRKQDIALHVLDKLNVIKSNRNIDLIPPEIWDILDQKFESYRKTHYGCRRFLKNGGDQGRGKEGHCGSRGKSISRGLLRRIAQFLDNDQELLSLAESDILWDEIVSIEYAGHHETVDVSMAEDPNFVVNNFITHNTNLMLNIALNISEQGHKVLFVPLEMPWKDLTSRIICNRVNINNQLLAKPHLLSDEQMEKIRKAKSVWDNRNFAVLDAHQRMDLNVLRREIEKRAIVYEPKVVVIDYADIIRTDAKYQSRTIEIGEMLHALRNMGKQYGFHILSAAQMNRAAIKALREGDETALDSTAIHGSHNYSAAADTIFGLMKVSGENDKIKIHTIKARHGPSGQTGELNVDPSRYLITSTDGTLAMTSETDLELDLNRPPSEIAETVSEEPKEEKSVSFQGCDLDDLDSLDSDPLAEL